MDTQSTLDDPRITLFGRLVDCFTLLSKRLDDDLQAAVGLPLLWYGVLLRIARGPGGLRPMNELTNATAFTSGGVTRLVDRMEAAGYVERRPCPSDRRVTYVGLTQQGQAMLERATTTHLQGIQRHMIAVLEPAEATHLDAILTSLAASQA